MLIHVLVRESCIVPPSHHRLASTKLRKILVSCEKSFVAFRIATGLYKPGIEMSVLSSSRDSSPRNFSCGSARYRRHFRESHEFAETAAFVFYSRINGKVAGHGRVFHSIPPEEFIDAIIAFTLVWFHANSIVLPTAARPLRDEKLISAFRYGSDTALRKPM